MRIRRRDRGLDGIGGRLAVERRIPRTPEQGHRGLQHGEAARIVPIEASEILAVRLPLRPRQAERARPRPERIDRLLVRRRHGPQNPDPRIEHEGCGGHPGHQRELRVPLLDRQGLPALDAVVARGIPHDLLVWEVEARSAPQALLLETGPADLGKESRRAVLTGIQSSLRRGIVELHARAHPCTLDAMRGLGAGSVELERPHEGGAVFAGKQRRLAFADRDGISGTVPSAAYSV